MRWIVARTVFLLVSLHTCTAMSAPKCSDLLGIRTTANTQQTRAVRSVLGDLSRNKPELLEQINITGCRSRSCIQIESETRIKFFVEIKSEVGQPEITISNNRKTLTLPSVEALSLEANRSIFRRFLVGHELHPYTAGGRFRFKPSQSVALRAFVGFLKSGKKSFLHVAPTSMGKGVNLALAYQARLSLSDSSKLSIFTADRVKIVDQIAESLKEKDLRGEPEIINWNEPGLTFSELVLKIQNSERPIALAITTQSLKPLLSSLGEKSYKSLAERLDGLYIDEAHHYGATETFSILSHFLNASNGFLYGSTATPVHQKVNLRDYFEVEHWSYLNGRRNLFEEHTVEKGLEQLRLGIKKGEISPFDELYIVGEPNFSTSARSPLFVTGKSQRHVLNPEHYPRLAQILFPIISSNKKGFIVAATIAEAQRITKFLGESFPSVKFEAYHSKLPAEERSAILERSQSMERHYTVAVRSLDEGVNLPHLSAYIDLNTSVSVKQMIHRIGRVLRLSNGKISSDILFLSDFENEEMAKDLLLVMDAINKSSFDSGTRRDVSGDIDFINSEVQGLSRADLLDARSLLNEAAQRFWNKEGHKWMTFDEARSHVSGLGLKTVSEFRAWLKSDQRPESFPKVPGNMYRKDGWTGIVDFLGVRVEWMSFKEAEAFIRTQGLKTQADFAAWAKSEKRPASFPTNPQVTYKDLGWKNFTDFLNTGRAVKGQWMSFENAMVAARLSGTQSRRDYQEWVRSSADRPIDLPSNPDVIYKDSGWISWPHFLGYERMSFEEARTLVQSKGFKTGDELRAWIRSDEKPSNFPGDPAKVYKNEGWISYGDFLGTGTIAKQNMTWMSYSEAVALMRAAGIRSMPEFEQWKNDGNRPNDFPAAPANVYSKEWKGFREFFGTNFMSYQEAKTLVRGLKFKSIEEFEVWLQSDSRPVNFPKTPRNSYKDNGWSGFKDFLGLE